MALLDRNESYKHDIHRRKYFAIFENCSSKLFLSMAILHTCFRHLDRSLGPGLSKFVYTLTNIARYTLWYEASQRTARWSRFVLRQVLRDVVSHCRATSATVPGYALGGASGKKW
jgi:hypothetical protein